MRDLIESYCKRYNYLNSDSEYILSAYDKIAANSAAAAVFESICSQYRKTCDIDYNEADRMAKEAGRAVGVHDFTSTLLMYIMLSFTLEERYIERNIDIEIFDGAMRDITYKIRECKTVKGIVGVFTNWFSGFYKLTRFALGRLQFEIIPMKCDFDNGEHRVFADEPVINMHIPSSGVPLTKERYENAFSLAKAFFADKIARQDVPFVCSSWLLDPVHEIILSESSNILAFKREFEIISSSVGLGENLWRIFGTDEKNPERLPASTSLQRAYKNHLLKEGRVGSAYGILFR